MRILFALSYYTPHLSGLTNYARRLAEGLAGTLRFPEFPPMLCLLGMHRGIHRALSASPGDDQARVLLGDPVIWSAMVLFIAAFLVG